MTRMEGKENHYRVLRFTTWRRCSQLHCILVHQLAIARFEVDVVLVVVCFCKLRACACGFQYGCHKWFSNSKTCSPQLCKLDMCTASEHVRNNAQKKNMSVATAQAQLQFTDQHLKLYMLNQSTAPLMLPCAHCSPESAKVWWLH